MSNETKRRRKVISYKKKKLFESATRAFDPERESIVRTVIKTSNNRKRSILQYGEGTIAANETNNQDLLAA